MTPEEIERLVAHRRHIEIKKCERCQGWGSLMYSNTATWRRGGMAGQMCTPGVCDLCWGSGDEARPWTDLRKLADEEDQRVVARAASLLADSLGEHLTTMRSAHLALAEVLETQEKRRKLPEGVNAYTWTALTLSLAKRLRAFAGVER